jgi:hypothetical protein
MKNFLLASVLFLAIPFGSSTLGQHESKAKAELEKKFSSEYSNIKYVTKYEKWEKFRMYNSYTYIADVKAKPPFKCNTSVIQKQRMSVEIWSDGTIRAVNNNRWSYLTNMNELDWNQLDSELKKAYEKGDFNPLDYLHASDLNQILEIKSVSIIKPADPEMEGAHPNYYNLGAARFYENFEDYTTPSENHLTVPIRITVRRICGNSEVCEAHEIYAKMHFKRSNCNQPFQFFKFDKRTIGTKMIKISESKVSQNEMEALRKQTIGREMAEKRAQEELNALPKVDVPNFSSAKDMILWTREFLFEVDSPEKLKSFILRNYDRKYFFDNSQYLLTHSGQSNVNKIIATFFEDIDYNFHTIYCPTVINGIPGKNRYSFKSKNGLHTAEIVVTNTSGKWLISEINVSLPNPKNFVDAQCPEPVVFETVKNDEFGFNIKIPKGFEVKDWDIKNGDRKIMYSATVNGTEYLLIAYHYKSAPGNFSASQMKATAEQNRKSWMLGYATYDEELTNFSLNGVEGAEGRFSAKPSGSNVPTKPTWYRSVMQGKVLYEIIISGIDWTTQNDEFMNGLVSTAKFDIAPNAEDINYKKGDYVLVNTSGSRWDKGIIEKVEPDGRYSVRLYEQNKTGTIGASKLKIDSNPNKKAAGEGSKLPSIKIK